MGSGCHPWAGRGLGQSSTIVVGVRDGLVALSMGRVRDGDSPN